jgi:hypothetical protein
MKRWLAVIGIMIGMAACAGQRPAVDGPAAVGVTPSAEAAVVGKVLVPAQSGGMQLLVTDVSFLELSSSEYSFSVNFELTNLDLDQSKITKDVFEFSDAAGNISKPDFLMAFAQGEHGLSEYTLQRGETQPFSISGSTDSSDEIALVYRPASGAAPIRVSVVSAPANPQSRFRALDLLSLATPQGEFSQPIQLVAEPQTAGSFALTSFAEPERYLHGTLFNGQENIGSLSIYVYDDPQNTQLIFDSRVGANGAGERHQVGRLGPASMYVEGMSGVQRFASAGFMACHATAIVVFSNADPSLFPAKAETIAYLEQLKQRLEPQVCP